MKTILIVDDEYAIVESLADLLTDDGYRVVSAANGKDGLARVQAEKRSGPPNPSWPSPAGPRRLRAGLEPSTPGISRIM